MNEVIIDDRATTSATYIDTIIATSREIAVYLIARKISDRSLMQVQPSLVVLDEGSGLRLRGPHGSLRQGVFEVTVLKREQSVRRVGFGLLQQRHAAVEARQVSGQLLQVRVLVEPGRQRFFDPRHGGHEVVPIFDPVTADLGDADGQHGEGDFGLDVALVLHGLHVLVLASLKIDQKESKGGTTSKKKKKAKS